MIASRDLLATDVTGLAVLRHHGTNRDIQDLSPWAQPKIRHGIALGLGAASAADIDVRADGVQELADLRRLMA